MLGLSATEWMFPRKDLEAYQSYKAYPWEDASLVCIPDVVAALDAEEVGDRTHSYGCPLRNQNVSGSSKI